MDKLPLINKELNDTKKGIDRIIKNFQDLEMPYKIRKMELMKSLNLPIPRSDFFSVRDIEDLKKRIEQRLLKGDGALIIRVACVPDKLSMPFFYVEDTNAVDSTIKKINELTKKNESITHLILQQAVSSDLVQNKVSGRILLEANEVFPREQVLEIFKGARSTGALNTLDTKDKNYRRLEKHAGQFMKIYSDVDDRSDIKEDEMRDIYRYVKKYEPDMHLVRGIYAKSANKKTEKMAICFEFSYLNGNFVFTDFD